MDTTRLMVPGSTTLGQLPRPSPEEICALTGSSQVINPSIRLLPSLRPIHFAGYDRTIQSRIYDMLRDNERFRAAIADLLINEPVLIQIEEEMSNHSFVVFLLFYVMPDGHV